MSERAGSSPGLAGGGGSPELVRRAIDLTYEARQRALSLRWSIINAIILLVFAYDLTRWCAGSGVAVYVEAGAAGAALAGAVRHALRLLRAPRHPALPITPAQRRLLALQDTALDGSLRLVEEDTDEKPRVRASGRCEAECVWSCSGRGSPSRSPASGGVTPPRAPPSPPASPPRSPPSPTPHDRFIADSDTLTDYLKQYTERSVAESMGAESVAVCGVRGGGGAPRYAVSSPAPLAPPAPPQPRLWSRLNIDPERLTQFNLNLRLWIHVTILSRLVREMALVDGALARLGLAGLGAVSTERLRTLAAAATTPHHPLHPLIALLPFLEPFQDQRYVVQRIRELSRGGCLSEYRWCGGGEGRGAGAPPDAALILSLVAAYLDCALPPPPARPFSALHLAPAPPAHPAPAPPAHPAPLRIVTVSQRPPHYALALDGELLEVGAGRNNLLHTLLLLIAAAARRAPPASPLQRHNLGPAGLNMLWIIGR